MPKRNTILPFVLLLLFLPATPSFSTLINHEALAKEALAKEPDLNARQIFSTHYKQLRSGKLLDITATVNELKDYPLTPYLEYQLLRNQLAYGVAEETKLRQFLAAHPDTVFQQHLQAEWLEQLGKAKNWSSFLIETASNPNPLNARLTCFQILGEEKIIGISPLWEKKARHYWQTNQPLPNNCQQLTNQLHQLKLLTAADYQNMALKLMRQGNASSAKLLQNKLSKKDQQWLSFWLAGKANSIKQLEALLEKKAQLTATPAIKDEILTQLLNQQGLSNPSKTLDLAKQLHKKNHLSQTAFWQAKERLAIRTAWEGDHVKTLQAFAPLPSKVLSAEGHEWYARTLLRQADWPELVKALAAFPATLLAKSEWRYWQAHALNQTQQTSQATALLKPLAQERHYYGFLAAKELGQPLQMNALVTPINSKLVQQLSLNPGIQNAAELYATGFTEEARHEWLHALKKAKSADWLQAAWLANAWGWHSVSVDAVHKAGLNNAIELRFPLAHLETLRPLAEQANLDLPLVLALIRKESLFNPQARSRVGALGLMQVMPATGKQVSRTLQLKMHPETDLLKPEYNLPIGINYLASLMQRYDNNPVLAAAAYNAGPTRTNLWQANLGKEIDPLWVERITYGETRDYVKSLLAFREVYAWRLAQQETLRQAQVNLSNPPKG